MGKLVNVRLITEYMKANNLTKKEFCRQCKIKRWSLYKIMHCKDFNLADLFKISRKTDVPVCEFFR